ncbi:MAG: hypothetical protein LUD68_09650 [Rikenellaceae bacterium]|nr:hypothetical protein [Rikenellaceae bacterium]
MERELYERFGEFGLGADRDRELPQIGAVHLAAGYLLSSMLGCRIEYTADAALQVVCAHRDDFQIDESAAFQSPDFLRLLRLMETLEKNTVTSVETSIGGGES